MRRASLKFTVVLVSRDDPAISSGNKLLTCRSLRCLEKIFRMSKSWSMRLRRVLDGEMMLQPVVKDSRLTTDSPAKSAWNTEALRELLTAAFSDEELTTLCFDHFPAGLR